MAASRELVARCRHWFVVVQHVAFYITSHLAFSILHFSCCMLRGFGGLVLFEEVAYFGEQFLLGAGFGLGRGFFFFLLGELVDTLEHEEDAECDD